jgi:hypothetical protein
LDVSTVGGSAAGRVLAATLGAATGFSGRGGALAGLLTLCAGLAFGAGLGRGIAPEGLAAGAAPAAFAGFGIWPEGRGIAALGVFAGRGVATGFFMAPDGVASAGFSPSTSGGGVNASGETTGC